MQNYRQEYQRLGVSLFFAYAYALPHLNTCVQKTATMLSIYTHYDVVCFVMINRKKTTIYIFVVLGHLFTSCAQRRIIKKKGTCSVGRQNGGDKNDTSSADNGCMR